ncbi:MAG TPA: hypothetical protein PLD88_06060, partial [Candidatus Berkiella sp.]|nr:hypothetical protein [Candidatus Berkiella sp.]
GGYPSGQPKTKLNKEVYICDLPGLQFQQLDNTGRHVLISANNDFPQGDLDQEIYHNTVGANKPTYHDALKDKSNRFIKGTFKNNEVYFDTHAYYAFVAQDFVLAAKTIHIQAKDETKGINFKFLKYGVGFFAEDLDGEAKNQLSEHLTQGVLLGLKRWIKLPTAQRDKIKRIELPFYKEAGNVAIQNTLNEIERICAKHNIEFAATTQDALAPTSKQYITAATNCSDPHVPTGNEMHYGSVDAAIAENLARKGNNFSPICNKEMKCQFLAMQPLSQKIIKNQEPQGFSAEIISKIGAMKWSAMIGIGAAFLLNAGYGIGLSALAGGVLVFIGCELLRAGRELVKQAQYQTYIKKDTVQIRQINETQQVA